MSKFVTVLFVFLISVTQVHSAERWLTEEQNDLLKIWPADVPIPPGLKFYKPTEFNMGLSVTNEVETISLYRLTQHQYYSNAETVINPNSLPKWAFPGGLDKVELLGKRNGVDLYAWGNRLAIALPPGKSIRVFKERVAVPNSHPLPKISWAYPDGTIFVDMLYSKDGLFELRQRTKTKDTWVASTPFKGGIPPKGYNGPGKKCSECHEKAGLQESYSMGIRGGDTVFSFSPLIDGSLNPDYKNLPITN